MATLAACTAHFGKRKAKLEKELAGITGRLSSPNFVEKAPEKVVAETKAQALELTEQLEAIKDRMEQMVALSG